jgi:hypothetical protein
MALTTVQPLTYLQLVQSLFYEVGASGSAPTTTVGQKGEALRLVNYIHDSELDIQNHWGDWKWLRKTLTCYTIAGTNTGIATTQGGSVSAQPADLAEWDFKTFQIQPIGDTYFTPLETYEWEEVRMETWDLTDQDQPWRAIIMPDNTLRWDLTPDQSYPLQIEYRSVPYDLKNDSDVSNIPARFANRIIVEWARMKYGLFENAAEQVSRARAEIYGVVDDQGIKQTQGLLAELENDQIPNAKNGRLQQGNDIVIGSGGYGGGSRYGDERYW